MPGIWLIFFFTILYGGHGDFSKAFWICLAIIMIGCLYIYIKGVKRQWKVWAEEDENKKEGDGK